MEQIKIIHFQNGGSGGVLSVIRNLLEYRQHPNIENHIIYTINQDQIPNYKAQGLAGAASEQVFYYSTKWNFYYTCRQLAKILPGPDAVLIAHDWLELAVISNLGLNYPVIQFLHGDYDYYYKLAQRHQSWIDTFICVSASIADELKRRIPERSNNIHYLRFPVPEIIGKRAEQAALELVFAGRCEKAKGYHLLPIIDAALQQRQIHANWHIAGPGSEQPELQQQWKQANVKFYGNLSQKELTALLLKATAFILPSIAEGMPVSVVEAMKAGAIPVVNDLKGGLQELVQNGITGYRIINNNPLDFAEALAGLTDDKDKTYQLSTAATKFARNNFSPATNTKLIENCFLQAATSVKEKNPSKVTGSRLDHRLLPNLLVIGVRTFINYFSK